VADITRELTWIVVSKAEAVTPSAGTSRTRERLAWAGGLAATAALVMWLTPFGVASPSADIPATRSVIQLDDGLHARAWQGVSSPGPVLSPDGRVLAYRAADANLLALRDMATGLTRVVPDTAEGMELFFSPDSRQLGFVTGGTIWRVALGGGERVKVFDGVSLLTRGATWADDGFIYYTPNFSSGLWRVSEDGSAPEELTTLDPDRAEKSHRYPFVLPGSRAVLFVVATARDATFDDATIEVLELEGRVRRTLVDRGTAPRYSPTGHLLYSRGSSLVAVPFDLESLETTGDPVVVAENVMARSAYGGADVTLSTTGSLVTIRPHAPVVTQFLAVQRDGTAETIAEIAGSFTEGRVSPDGTRLATWKIAATSQISILDLDTGRLSPLTFEWDNESLLWSADGSRLIAQSTSGGSVTNLLAFPAFGPGPPARLTTSANIQQVGWRSAYGSIVPFVEVDPKTGPDIWTLDLASGSARPILQTPFDEWAPALSWNGKWLAYTSNQSGEQVVLVQAYPSGGRTWPVSRGTGAAPHWHPNGRELIYRDGDAVVSVPFTEDATFRPGSPVTLFEWNDRMFDVLEDGRFLMRRQDLPPPVAQFDLVVNWFSELRQKMAGAAR
jgi:WD40 repeat protein